MSNERSPVAILGAGVAGLSTAIALRRAGFSVEVFERRPGPAALGGGMVCWPNATFVLKELGLLAAVEARAGRPSWMRRISRRGGELGAIDVARLGDLMGHPSLSVLRRDLQAVMLEALETLGVRVQYGRRVVRIEPDVPGRARVVFEGGVARTPWLVIGADGRMRSAARRFVHGDARPVYQGFVNWVGVCELTEPLFTDMAVRDYWGVGERFGIVPLSPRAAYWAAAASAPLDLPDEALSPDGLGERFRGWPELVRRTIAQSAPPHLIRVHDHDPIARWHRDQVLLVGDAAHAPLPTSGQGACQALEDAWHLAGLLGEASDPGSCFEAFTARRSAKTAAITAMGRGFARRLFSLNAAESAIRDAESAATGHGAVVEGMARGWSAGLPL
ncbi:MAG: FAD-dependent monooxygenase [Sandaracinaceae bacterium]|nr:MAG: FAD-dependent monooxygenase [Sandaracinaceae bacterium]